MFWDLFKKKQDKEAVKEQQAPQAPAAAPAAPEKSAAPEKAKPAAAAEQKQPSQEQELERQIEKDINRMEPGLAAQLKNPAVRQKLLDLAKKMMKDGVDIKSEKAVKAWLKDHPEELGGNQQKVETFKRQEPKVGRNDDCPCGSGKKYKKCCGKGEA